MKIKIINPNTTWTMTEDISVAGKKFARPDTEVYAVSPSTGPESIESMYDEYLAVPGVLSEIIKGDREELNCPILCGQYKKEPLVGKIEF